MGDDGGGAMSGGGGASPNIGADGAPVPTGGTARDFGNMLNAYMPHKKKAVHGFSPWTKMTLHKQERIK